ncbi:MAG: T9SS type A sorting domain-containing protein [Ignavibacteriaceae bacterium]|jgi:photosystem II stability/assembly factor-like uncharacterized protein|nr:MAG: glycosyl hydrolase [Chlorobi bacterium OLB4]MBW7855270.1 T9SS type A sorting domain-containing protein [Ignavibacteria bacterium]MEB2329552.1 T9SS type A sorting domain-containing protein [Ignavibacteriaceae bacterium]OQY77809.1 MAG: hypothetical protein B6D43_04685 [Ignavibacteriales bacterium UTCHB1]
MKILSLVFLITALLQIVKISNAQELNIPGSIYNGVDSTISSRKPFNREKWFYEQRMFPNNYLPKDAYSKALSQRDEMRKQNGYYYNDYTPSWINLGPTSGYYFNYGYISSRIVTLAIHPYNHNIIYIGTANGGVWKTTDGGISWNPKSDNETSLSSGAIAIDPMNPEIIYYGTGEATYSLASYYGRGLLKSTNGGTTWTNYSSDLPSLSYTSRIVIRPGNSNHLLAAMGNSGLYRSTNAGQNWHLVFSNRTDDVVFSPTGDTAYASGNLGIVISTDGGATFPFNAGGYTSATRNHIAICNSSPNILYAAGYYASNPNETKIRVFKSTNHGEFFYPVAVGTNFEGKQAWYDFYIHVSPHDPDLAFVGSIDIWRTTNGGDNFYNITNGYNGGNVHVDQHNMAFHPVDPNIVFCTNDGGINKSTNKGDTWTNLNQGLTLTQFYRIASNPSNYLHILGGTQDNGTQRTYGSIDWVAAFGGDGGEVVYHSVSNQFMLGETQNNGVKRSMDFGGYWVSATEGLTGSAAWIGPLISHPDSNGIFYTARQQVFKTTNWGANWFPISSGTTGTIRELAISKSDPEVMYASISSYLYKSTNMGYNFTSVTNGLPSRTLTSIQVHPDSSNVAVVSFSGFGTNKIFKTTNQGNSWFSIAGNLPDSPVNDVLIFYPGFFTSTYIAATDVGVFVTDDWGTKWRELTYGLPNTVCMSLDYHDFTGRLRVGTFGRGVWEFNILNTISQIATGSADNFELLQNYPNPFNPSTVITFKLPSKQKVKLTVYNTLGEVITEPVNSMLSAGTYNVNLNMSGFSSGLYFYKIETDNFSDTKKMIFIK